MAIHLYIIESLGSTTFVDMESFRMNASAYLKELDPSCTTCKQQFRTSDEMQEKIKDFFSFCNTYADNDWVVLLLSMHAKPPESSKDVATCAVSAQGSKDVVEWYKLFDSVSWRQRTIVIIDVCWGGAPTPTRSMTRAKRPVFVFGPVRPAKRLELDTAASLLIARLEKDEGMLLESAKEIVDFLNNTFPSDPSRGTAFYRVWWWVKKCPQPKAHPPE